MSNILILIVDHLEKLVDHHSRDLEREILFSHARIHEEEHSERKRNRVKGTVDNI